MRSLVTYSSLIHLPMTLKAVMGTLMIIWISRIRSLSIIKSQRKLLGRSKRKKKNTKKGRMGMKRYSRPQNIMGIRPWVTHTTQ